jgi:hypothetical protein
MAFLRHDGPHSNDVVLFDGEGGTHVKGPSTRVAQHPGGNSSFSFGWTDPQKENKAPAATGRRKIQADVTGKPGSAPQAPIVASPAPVQAPAYHQQQQASPYQPPAQEYNALFCNEGSQVRTRPARKVVAPPGGASSIIF